MNTIYHHPASMLLLAAAILAGGCAGERDLPAPEPGTGDTAGMRLELAISLGGASRADEADGGSAGPAQTADPETRVDDILVMLFTPDPATGAPATLWRALEGRNLEDFGDARKRFDITVGFDPASVPEKLVAVAVANAADRLGDITAGEGMNWSYEDCRTRLLTDYASRMEGYAPADGTPGAPLFTMWGIAGKEIETDLQVQTVRISLVRDMARVTLSISDKVAAENFRLAHALVYNRFNGISPMPALASLGAGNRVTLPTLTGSVEKTECEEYAVRPYSADPQGMTLYAAEQDVLMGSLTGDPADGNRFRRPALIVGGYYRGKADRVYWYRIDFTDTGADGAESLVDLLRNHSYAVDIKAVNGPGEDTPAEAYNAVTTHVDAEIVKWEDIGRDAIFDGSNWIAAPRGVTLGPDAGDEAEVALFTNVGPDAWEAAWGAAGADWESLPFAPCTGAVAADDFSAAFPDALGEDGSASIRIRALTALPEDMESRTLTLYVNVTPKLRMVIPVVQSRGSADDMHSPWDDSNIYGDI